MVVGKTGAWLGSPFRGREGSIECYSISDLRSQLMNADAVGIDLGGDLSSP